MRDLFGEVIDTPKNTVELPKVPEQVPEPQWSIETALEEFDLLCDQVIAQSFNDVTKKEKRHCLKELLKRLESVQKRATKALERLG